MQKDRKLIVPENKIGGRPEIMGHPDVQYHNSYPTNILEPIHVIVIFSWNY